MNLKKFLCRITASGVESIFDDFVFNGYTWGINGGKGETTIRIARKFNSFGEDQDIKLFNDVRIYLRDKEVNEAVPGDYDYEGYLIYWGYIIEYIPVISGSDEYVDVTLWPYSANLAVNVLEDSGDTTKTYTSMDTFDILRDVMSKYNAVHPDVTLYDPGSPTTGNVITYTFKQNTFLEAVEICRTSSPYLWYWIESNKVMTFKQADPTVVDHYLQVGKDVQDLELTRSAKKLFNRLYFLGNATAGTYIKDSHSASIDLFGVRADRQQDERITDDISAIKLSENYLNLYDHKQLVCKVVVADSNGSGGGYDIESFYPGQVVKLVNKGLNEGNTLWNQFNWDQGYWNFAPISAL